jgi:hypothetical protein
MKASVTDPISQFYGLSSFNVPDVVHSEHFRVVTPYGSNWRQLDGRAADVIDEILRGARPGDIPPTNRPGLSCSRPEKPEKTVGIEVRPSLWSVPTLRPNLPYGERAELT